jgi:hypothetical protein
VTLSGIVIELSEEQDEKALLPILVTLLPMIYSVTCSPKIVLILALSTIELESIVTEVNEVQPEKAQFPILVTLLGIVTEVSEEQPEKA